MKKTGVALYGRANTGKSMTIMKVCELLESKYACDVDHELTSARDIRVVLTIDGVRIGIESQGDPGGRLEASLSLFVQVGCAVIICATRTRGRTVDSVNALRPNYEVAWYQQDVRSDSSQWDAGNSAVAERIAEHAERAVSAQQAA